MHRSLLTGGVLALSVVAAFVMTANRPTALASPQAGPDRGAFKPVADIHMLMEAQEAHLDSIQRALEAPGDKTAKTVRFHAEVLAELANVNRYHQDKSDYIGWATDLRDTAMSLAQKAGEQTDADPEAMKSLVEKIKSTCTACHDVYD